MTIQTLEKFQILVYLAAISCGLMTGSALSHPPDGLEVILWPLLGLLLYSTFTQVPLAGLGPALSNTPFLRAAVLGNFVVLPLIVWGLMQFLPGDPAIRLGVLLVLLVPCTDWFITFTHLGRGDARYAIAFSPVSLVLQLVLLPVYLWLFLGQTFTLALVRQEMLVAFGGLIILPLLGAFLTEKWVEKKPSRCSVLEVLAWFPVPLLALVLFVIAAAQVNLITGSMDVLGQLLKIYTLFLLIAGLSARCLARLFRLPASQGRVLAFSLGTRNSFVVLPLALALPQSFELAVVAIVFQSLVELLGMVFYLWWIPQRLFPEPGGAAK
ncbi:arsenic resistance protein [Desulfonatronovibrio hydrogenovorans]|uniref:arsenic resistance protein n=1 Tax=Desulfonatronovibrio hydrogenovorans TaxID=53245 RepID=UPI00048C2294|nr:bile acid:sodium symporter [Desulfonatronovibrio hydrogenovorans]